MEAYLFFGHKDTKLSSDEYEAKCVEVRPNIDQSGKIVFMKYAFEISSVEESVIGKVSLHSYNTSHLVQVQVQESGHFG